MTTPAPSSTGKWTRLVLEYVPPIAGSKPKLRATWVDPLRTDPKMAEVDFDPKKATGILDRLNQWIHVRGHRRDGVRFRPHVPARDLHRRIRTDILQGAVSTLFRERVEQANPPVRALTILGNHQPALFNLPWEALRRRHPAHPSQDDDLASLGIAIVRMLDGPHDGPAIEPQPSRDKLTVLFAAAQPEGLSSVDADTTRLELDRCLWHARELGCFQLLDLGAATADSTLDRLGNLLGGDTHCDVLILQAHGAIHKGSPQIALVGRQGVVDWITVDDLMNRWPQGRPLPRLVILCSCHQGLVAATDALNGFASRLIARGVTAVLGFQGEISTEGAATVAAEVVWSLFRDLPVADLSIRAREVLGRHSIERILPVLWLNRLYGLETPLFQVSRPNAAELKMEINEYIANRGILAEKKRQAKLRRAFAARALVGPLGYPPFLGPIEETMLCDDERSRYLKIIDGNAHPSQLERARTWFEWDVRSLGPHSEIDNARRELEDAFDRAVGSNAVLRYSPNDPGDRWTPAVLAPRFEQARVRLALKSRLSALDAERERLDRTWTAVATAPTHADLRRLLEESEGLVRSCARILRRMIREISTPDEKKFQLPNLDAILIEQRRLNRGHALRLKGECAMAASDWDTAVAALEEARKISDSPRELDIALQAARASGAARRLVRSAKRKVRRASSATPVPPSAWISAAQDVANAAEIAVEGAERSRRFWLVRQAPLLQRLAARYAEAARTAIAAERYQPGLGVTLLSSQSKPLAQALRVEPRKPAQVALWRNRPWTFEPSPREPDRDTLVLLALRGDWDLAREEYRRFTPDFEFDRIWAAVTLFLADQRGATALDWGRALVAWSLVGGTRYVDGWRAWRKRQGDSFQGMDDWIGDLRAQYVLRLQDRRVLVAAALTGALGDSELRRAGYDELILIALGLWRDWLPCFPESSLEIARVVAEMAKRAGIFAAMMDRLWSDARSYIEPWAKASQPRELDSYVRPLVLLDGLCDLLANTRCNLEAREMKADCLVWRALGRLDDRDNPEFLRASFDDFDQAYALHQERDAASDGGLALAMTAASLTLCAVRLAQLARQAGLADEDERVARAQTVLDDADACCAKTNQPDESGLSLLKRARSVLLNVHQDPAAQTRSFEDALAEIRGPNATAGPPTFAERARIALKNDELSRAVGWLQNALEQPDPTLDLELTRNVLTTYTSAIQSTSYLMPDPTDFGCALQTAELALEKYPEDGKIQWVVAALRTIAAQVPPPDSQEDSP